MWEKGDCWAVPVGSHPETVTVGVTKLGGEDFRKVVELPYEEWDGRCPVCYPPVDISSI